MAFIYEARYNTAMSGLTTSAALYSKVALAIEEDIRAGNLRPGDRLPSERDLAEHFEVSRVTVRRAIGDLADVGLVESHQGSGTFVTASVVSDPANALMSFTELGRSRGLTASAEVFVCLVRPTTLHESEQLGIAPGAEVFELERVRKLEKLPVSIDHSLIPAVAVPGAESVEFTSISLYAVLESHGYGPRRTDYTVSASGATDRQAQLLDTKPGFPLLCTHTKSFDSQGRVIEIGNMFYRGDRYQFHASLRKSP